MNKQEETLRLSLRALETSHPRFGVFTEKHKEAISAIREVLKQEQPLENGVDCNEHPEFLRGYAAAAINFAPLEKMVKYKVDHLFYAPTDNKYVLTGYLKTLVNIDGNGNETYIDEPFYTIAKEEK
jgi:hypothetical protein